jgi:excisionase family DNA binding protein|tara:strand:- start:295 stop:504 length:210 start_codon:yes stop_codon:yes gene_type:complete
MAEENWLTVSEIATMLSVDAETVRRWLRDGELRGVILGRRAGYRVSERDLDAFLESRSTFQRGEKNEIS